MEAQELRCDFSEPSNSNHQVTYGNPALLDSEGQLTSRSVITLPIVVHIVWKSEEENISEEQILSQIEVLNEDFRALNENIDIVPNEFQGLIADTEIEFCLAAFDPNGNATNGITRTQTQVDFVGTAISNGSRAIFFSSNGGKDAWPTDQYINVWVATREFALGAASFPGQSSPETDGVVIDPRYFGTTGLAEESIPFHLGKTLSHELGHYFGLGHLNGPNASSDCTVDDGILDTPLQSGIYLGACPSTPVSSCGSNDMYMNIMSLTEDACLAMFTPGQKAVIMATLEGPRSGLMEQIICSPTSTNTQNLVDFSVTISPNPSTGWINLEFETTNFREFKVELFNSAGSLLLLGTFPSEKNITLDLNKFGTGLFFIRVSNDQYFMTKKVMLLN